MKGKNETVSEYAMRLRTAARYCKFEDNLEKEIERKFVVGCGMLEVERKCVRLDNMDLKTVCRQEDIRPKGILKSRVRQSLSQKILKGLWKPKSRGQYI